MADSFEKTLHLIAATKCTNGQSVFLLCSYCRIMHTIESVDGSSYLEEMMTMYDRKLRTVSEDWISEELKKSFPELFAIDELVNMGQIDSAEIQGTLRLQNCFFS